MRAELLHYIEIERRRGRTDVELSFNYLESLLKYLPSDPPVNNECNESIWNSVVRFAREHMAKGDDRTSDLGKTWAADRIHELEAKVTKLTGDIQCMVNKAADNHLEGYREQGRKIVEGLELIDELKAQDRWILVTDRVPDTTRCVDALRDHCGAPIRECDATYYRVSDSWVIIGRDGNCDCDTVYAWRERPERDNMPPTPSKGII